MSPIPIFTGLGPEPTYEDVVAKVNTLVNELTNLMVSLDSLNIREINANDVNVTGTLTSVDIIGVTITGGLFRTAESGARVELTQAENERINFYSSVGNLIGSIGTYSSGGFANLFILDPQGGSLNVLGTTSVEGSFACDSILTQGGSHLQGGTDISGGLNFIGVASGRNITNVNTLSASTVNASSNINNFGSARIDTSGGEYRFGDADNYIRIVPGDNAYLYIDGISQGAIT